MWTTQKLLGISSKLQRPFCNEFPNKTQNAPMFHKGKSRTCLTKYYLWNQDVCFKMFFQYRCRNFPCYFIASLAAPALYNRPRPKKHNSIIPIYHNTSLKQVLVDFQISLHSKLPFSSHKTNSYLCFHAYQRDRTSKF